MSIRIERSIIIPTQDNNGKGLKPIVDEILAEILVLAEGFSQVPQSGSWRDPYTGIVYHDNAIRVTTLVNEDIDAKIVTRLPYWCYRLRQESLLTTYAIVNAVFVETDKQKVTHKLSFIELKDDVKAFDNTFFYDDTEVSHSLQNGFILAEIDKHPILIE